MPDPRIGYGTTWEADYGAGFIPILRLVEIGEFGGDADDVEISNHDSPNTIREWIRGWVDSGEISYTAIWIADASQVQIMQDVLSGANSTNLPNIPMRITIPGGLGVFAFNGYWKGAKINSGLEARVEMTGAAKVSGGVTFGVTESAGLTGAFFTMADNGTGDPDINPTPSGSVYDYIVTVNTDATLVTVTPTAAAGVITVNGAVVPSGVASGSIALGAAGSITPITIVVTETGETPKTYNIDVVRP